MFPSLFPPEAMLSASVGPNGAGKSTLVESIDPAVRPERWIGSDKRQRSQKLVTGTNGIACREFCLSTIVCSRFPLRKTLPFAGNDGERIRDAARFRV